MLEEQNNNTFHIEGRLKNVTKIPCDDGVEYEILVEVDGTESDGGDRYEKGYATVTAREDDPWTNLPKMKLYAIDGTIRQEEGGKAVYLASDVRRIKKVNHGRVKFDEDMRPVEWYEDERNEPPLWRKDREGNQNAQADA